VSLNVLLYVWVVSSITPLKEEMIKDNGTSWVKDNIGSSFEVTRHHFWKLNLFKSADRWVVKFGQKSLKICFSPYEYKVQNAHSIWY